MRREVEFITLVVGGVVVGCILVTALVAGTVIDKTLRVVGI